MPYLAFSKILKYNTSNNFLHTKAKAKTGLLAPNLVQLVIISSVCVECLLVLGCSSHLVFWKANDKHVKTAAQLRQEQFLDNDFHMLERMHP